MNHLANITDRVKILAELSILENAGNTGNPKGNPNSKWNESVKKNKTTQNYSQIEERAISKQSRVLNGVQEAWRFAKNNYVIKIE